MGRLDLDERASERAAPNVFVSIVLFISDLITFPFSSFDLSLFFTSSSSSYLLSSIIRWRWEGGPLLGTQHTKRANTIPAQHIFSSANWGGKVRARTHMDGELQWSGRRVEWPACYIKTTKLGAERLFFLRIVPWVGRNGMDRLLQHLIDRQFPSRMDRAMGDWIGRQQDTSLIWWWKIPDFLSGGMEWDGVG